MTIFSPFLCKTLNTEYTFKQQKKNLQKLLPSLFLILNYIQSSWL